MNHKRAWLIHLIAFLWAVPALAQAPAQRKYTEKLLGPFPPEVHDSAVISPDGRRIAYVEQVGKQQAVVVDGTREKPYDRVDAFTFSPNSQWRAYAASAGGKWFLVINGKEQQPQVRIGPPIFSPHSKRLAYTALQSDGQHVLVMEATQAPGKPYERIFEGTLVFSPDSQRLAYGARQGDKWYLVVGGQETGGQETGPYDFLGSATGIHFSPSGTHVACAALLGKQWCLVLDGKPQKPYDNIGELASSADGRRLAYAALSGKKWRVVADGKQHKPYDAIGKDSLQFGPGSATLAYAAKSEGKWLVVAGGEEGRPYDGIGQMLFSPNGRLLACVARVASSEMVVLNTRAQRVFDRVGGGTLVFSADSDRLGYIARVGRQSHVVIDGKVLGEERKSPYDMVAYLTFTPDGKQYVYAATSGKTAFTVVGDREAAHRYDAIWTLPEARFLFDGPKTFHYLALKQGSVYLVQEEIE